MMFSIIQGGAQAAEQVLELASSLDSSKTFSFLRFSSFAHEASQ